MPGASALAGALGGRELRCLIGPVGYVPAAEMARPVPGASRYSRPRSRTAPANLQIGNQFRWVVDLNGWSPIPDQWFSSPEEASERFWEAASPFQPRRAR